MIPQLSEFFLDQWKSYFPHKKKPNSLNYLGISGSIEGGTTTYLAFAPRERSPFFSIKIHRSEKAEREVTNEKEILNSLKNYKELAPSVPEILYAGKINNVWILTQTILKGRPMTAALKNDGTVNVHEAKSNFDSAVDWLTQMNRATKNSQKIAVFKVQKEIIRKISLFRNAFSLSQKEEKAVSDIESQCDLLVQNGVFLRHGDYTRHNILLDSNGESPQANIIDWTFGTKEAAPFYDLFFFLTNYFLQIRSKTGLASYDAAFEYSFFSKNPYSALVKESTLNYTHQLKADIHLIRSHFLLFLIEKSLFELELIQRCATRGTLPRFTIYMSLENNKDFQEALKEQLWIRFFRLFVSKSDQFIL